MPDLSTRRWRTASIQAVLIVGLLTLAGAAAGWVWHALWAPAPPGVAVDGRWIPLPPVGSAAQFAGTGWFVLVGVVTGLLLGVLVGLLLSREELVSLGAVVAGSAAATWAMYRVGVALAPADPAPLAARAEDGTRLLGTLTVAGASPFAALPVGALIGLALTYLLVQRALWRAPEHPLAVRPDPREGDRAGVERVARSED